MFTRASVFGRTIYLTAQSRTRVHTVARFHARTMSMAESSSSAAQQEQTTNDGQSLRYADIGINLGDAVFRGTYYGKKSHQDDLSQVMSRATAAGCRKLMITGSDLSESQKAVQMAQEHPGLCYATIGVHPCSAHTFDSFPGGPTALSDALRDLAISARDSGHAVAFGEIGLDYDRLELCAKPTQQTYFRLQLAMAADLDMPLFLHCRAATDDFEAMLCEQKPPRGGCVHSFTGTLEEMWRFVSHGLDIGINGCSLKTEENLEVVRHVPLERLQLETDGPWCEIRPSHASARYLDGAPALPRAVKKEKWTADCMVKGRNEPCAIGRVAHVVAKVKGISVEEVCEAAWNNSIRMFGLGER